MAQRRSRSTIRSGVSSTSERRILGTVGEFAVTAIGRDRPGIVARLSEALLALEGNIEDSQMSILRGHFAVMLIVKLPDAVDPAELERRLEEVRGGLGLEAVSISAVDDLGHATSRPSHILTVYGADRPGIVHTVTSALAERDVNITDLETRLAGSPESPLYVMMLEIALGEARIEDVEAALREAGQRAGVEVSLRPLQVEAL
jgi:glycine cleavage system transcriptional repressor